MVSASAWAATRDRPKPNTWVPKLFRPLDFQQKSGHPHRMRLALIAILVCAGCGASYHNPRLKTKLETRAPFDLNCDQLVFQALETTRDVVTTYGVSGCGQRATYVLNVDSESWVLNVLNGAQQGSGGSPAQPSTGAPGVQ